MTVRKGRRVQFLPKEVAHLDSIFRQSIAIRLQLIDEVACGSQASGTGAPGRAWTMEGLLWSLGRDWKVEEESIVDYMRSEVRKWWHDFSERQLLTDLYCRTARRREGSGSPDSRRCPSHQEGLRVARAMLADVPDTSRFDSEWESAAVSEVLAALLLPPIGVRSPDALRKYIERSKASRVYFDALNRICEELNNRGEGTSRQLARWRAQVAGGHRRPPAKGPMPPNRPVSPATLLRDLQIQFTILVLYRIGVSPRGSSVSGCRIVSEALGLSEETVKRTWKERIWRRSFGLVMKKHSKAIATRTGLSCQ